jgi:peptide/nickel transport system substrate-binding protein
VGQPIFINPVIPASDADRDLSRLIFSSLADLADSIKRSDDGKTWRVRLKENLLWQDGQKLTADDVIFTVETIQNPESRSPLYPSFQGVKADRISELEVQFSLNNPYAFFESDHLRNLRIIPKHIFADIPIQNLRLSSYSLMPIGSGPYRAVAYERNRQGIITSFQLKANERYFGEKPYLPKITFKFYRHNNELIAAYNRGEIDGFGLVTAEPLTENKIKLRHNIYYLRSSRYYAVFINPNLAPAALKKAEVRHALAAAAQREQIIKEVFQSQAIPLYGPTALTANPFKETEKELISGLQLNLTVPDEAFLVKTAERLKLDWEAAGAKVNLVILAPRDLQEEVLKGNNYELLLFGNVAKKDQDLFAFWHSSQRFYPDQNLALYSNREVDRALEEFRKTFDTNRRLTLLQKISDTIAAEAPAIFLYSPDYLYITNPQLKGFDQATVIDTSDDRLVNIEKWHLKTRRALSQPATTGN